MCRNIRTLFNFDPPATDEEIRAAAVQFVRKERWFSAPSKHNEAAFNLAVEQRRQSVLALERGVTMNHEPAPGLYRHYKGGEYRVIGTARHSETDELMVVYRCLYDNNSLWVRPLSMFLETVLVDGAEMPRFSPVAPDRPDGPVAAELIAGLGLTRHPEGGWYRETYRAAGTIPGALLPERVAGERSFSTAIYFLLERGDISALHRIKSDELWHFHAGAPLIVHVITPEGGCCSLTLGSDPAAGETFQGVVPAGCWFGAETTGDYSLVGCTVAPGFDFADFEMGSRSDLLSRFPVHAGIIRRLTRDE